MKELIDKAAVVAEIERRINFFTEESKKGNFDINIAIELCGLENFLDTLEVKEVDLDREIYSCIRNLHTVPNFEELNKFARHFFELGIKSTERRISYDTGRSKS